MKRKPCFKFIPTVFLLSLLVAACQPKSESTRITDQDVAQVLNFAIDLTVSRFENPDYRIAPTFHSDLTDSIIIKSFSAVDDLQYDSTTLNEFAKIYEWGEGVEINPWISDKDKQSRISDEFHDLLIVASAPMVDDENRRIFFYVQVYYPDFEYNIKTLASFSGYQLTGERTPTGPEIVDIHLFTAFQAALP